MKKWKACKTAWSLDESLISSLTCQPSGVVLYTIVSLVNGFCHYHYQESSLFFFNEKFCILKKACLVQRSIEQVDGQKSVFWLCSVESRCSGVPVMGKSQTAEKQGSFYINICLCEVSNILLEDLVFCREKKMMLSWKVMVVASCIILYISLFIHADSSFQFFPI